VHQWVDRDDAGKRQQQHVGVTRGEERGDGGDAVGALAILHHHRLPPTLGQTLRQHSGGDVGTGARRQRDDQPNGALRPALGAARRRREHECEQQSRGKGGKATEGAHDVLTSCWAVIAGSLVFDGPRRAGHGLGFLR
jgi:hypothetical protein